MDQVVLDVSDQSLVAEARRQASLVVAPLRFDASTEGRVALAVTEAATNLIKHAGGGSLILRPLLEVGATGLEVISIDRGRGIANLQESLRDGHSTAGSPGFGLGTLTRIASDVQWFSQPGLGTGLRFEIWSGPRPPSTQDLEIGVVASAKPGEDVCGDGWSVTAQDDRRFVFVVDGLGHGPNAAAASRAACIAMSERPELPPAQKLTRLHDSLRSTRGAAAALAEVSAARGVGTFCGVGNISASVVVEGRSRSLVSHNGTLGHQLRKVQEFSFPFPRGALLIMHSDGVATRWDLNRYPGLEGRHPGLVAAILYRDYHRGSDDATIVVVRNTTAPIPGMP